eukprot:jgi/Hompol1/2290/HPOL_002889-RA
MHLKNRGREQTSEKLHSDGSPQSKGIQEKYKVVAGVPKVANKGNALKPLCSASYFLQITTTWDRGNRTVREKILREFVANNEKKTGPQLEKEFSNGASLFLTRISAWLRLTYLLAYDLALQLKAITIFISASSGSRFLSEFLEVGGVLTVLEILTLSQAKEVDKAEGLRLLLTVANNGRKYKEFICESFGVRQVTECLSKSRSEVTQDYARNLLAELGTGNPKFQMQVFKGLQSLLTSQAVSPTAQQMSGQALRTLLAMPPSFIDPTMGLLKSPYIQVQYEGYEILRELLSRPMLQDPILLQLIAILRNIVDESSDDTNDADRHRRNKIEQKGLIGQWGAISAEEQKEKDLITSGYVQQAYASKLLGIMAASSHELAERMIQFQLVSSLLNVVANVGHPDSQRYAANTLLYLVGHFDYVAYALRDHMGSNFFELLENKPDTFYRELTKEQVRYLRRNTFKIKKADSHPSLTDSDSGSESSDEESSMQKESKPAVDAAPAEFEAKGNKYVVNASVNEGTKRFTNELEKFRNTTLKTKKREGKKEFEVVYPPEMQTRLTNMKTDTKLFSKDMQISNDLERKRAGHSKAQGSPRASEAGISGNESAHPNQDLDDEMDMSPEEQEERRRLLELAAHIQEKENVQDASHESNAASSGDSGGNMSYRASVASEISENDLEILANEGDFGMVLEVAEPETSKQEDLEQSGPPAESNAVQVAVEPTENSSVSSGSG